MKRLWLVYLNQNTNRVWSKVFFFEAHETENNVDASSSSLSRLKEKQGILANKQMMVTFVAALAILCGKQGPEQ